MRHGLFLLIRDCIRRHLSWVAQGTNCQPPTQCCEESVSHQVFCVQCRVNAEVVGSEGRSQCNDVSDNGCFQTNFFFYPYHQMVVLLNGVSRWHWCSIHDPHSWLQYWTPPECIYNETWLSTFLKTCSPSAIALHLEGKVWILLEVVHHVDAVPEVVITFPGLAPLTHHPQGQHFLFCLCSCSF